MSNVPVDPEYLLFLRYQERYQKWIDYTCAKCEEVTSLFGIPDLRHDRCMNCGYLLRDGDRPMLDLQQEIARALGDLRITVGLLGQDEATNERVLESLRGICKRLDAAIGDCVIPR